MEQEFSRLKEEKDPMQDKISQQLGSKKSTEVVTHTAELSEP